MLSADDDDGFSFDVDDILKNIFSGDGMHDFFSDAYDGMHDFFSDTFVGERYYYVGSSERLPNGDELVHGRRGRVIGLASDPLLWSVRFPGNEADADVHFGLLSSRPPRPLPDGFLVGDTVYYAGASGDGLEFGLRGTVVGPARAAEGLTVLFDGNKGNVQLFFNKHPFSREPPHLLYYTGFALDEELYYNGTGTKFDNGDRLVYGWRGRVAGQAAGDFARTAVAMRFAHNQLPRVCYLRNLTRDPPPPLPGGFAPDDLVYYNGSSSSFDNGDVLMFGERGTVVGPATLASHKGKGLAVLFDGNKGTVQVFLNQLSREPLPSPPSGEYTWPIPGFSKIEETKLSSPTFQAGAFNWTLDLYPKGDDQQGQLSLYLSAADSATLPEGWARHASFTLTVKNHLEVVTRSVTKRAQRNGANNQTRVGGY
ncbi:hypothetical protein EMIHUDRAFT_195782 [Emiliania huxleyi CCMP1516]|uniref:MATH domain-containing protein n=2 Tax=Emiliania huxleyi TaxID=2903 RepID=A0A0D3JI22_EMIH1|nr:hypothetical protein EMIHUDRAFT_195782 [Emiliania huxleyi CCMP1516]EOD23157.1 hypothetical protein EMIHUDRAFT_195782 [Emiliania huxleyi CCMP1516]|eukprot:XP_005775586.1 hypothetical protein EMIHUDRAFT_195782 [Emiliania huxleyi CCMP1516]